MVDAVIRFAIFAAAWIAATGLAVAAFAGGVAV